MEIVVVQGLDNGFKGGFHISIFNRLSISTKSMHGTLCSSHTRGILYLYFFLGLFGCFSSVTMILSCTFAYAISLTSFSFTPPGPSRISYFFSKDKESFSTDSSRGALVKWLFISHTRNGYLSAFSLSVLFLSCCDIGSISSKIGFISTMLLRWRASFRQRPGNTSVG